MSVMDFKAVAAAEGAMSPEAKKLAKVGRYHTTPRACLGHKP